MEGVEEAGKDPGPLEDLGVGGILTPETIPAVPTSATKNPIATPVNSLPASDLRSKISPLPISAGST